MFLPHPPQEDILEASPSVSINLPKGHELCPSMAPVTVELNLERCRGGNGSDDANIFGLLLELWTLFDVELDKVVNLTLGDQRLLENFIEACASVADRVSSLRTCMAGRSTMSPFMRVWGGHNVCGSRHMY